MNPEFINSAPTHTKASNIGRLGRTILLMGSAALTACQAPQQLPPPGYLVQNGYGN
jgi:hypothetical protein